MLRYDDRLFQVMSFIYAAYDFPVFLFLFDVGQHGNENGHS